MGGGNDAHSYSPEKSYFCSEYFTRFLFRPGMALVSGQVFRQEGASPWQCPFSRTPPTVGNLPSDFLSFTLGLARFGKLSFQSEKLPHLEAFSARDVHCFD